MDGGRPDELYASPQGISASGLAKKPPVWNTGGFLHTRQNNFSVAYRTMMGDCCNTKPASRGKPVFTVMLNLLKEGRLGHRATVTANNQVFS